MNNLNISIFLPDFSVLLCHCQWSSLNWSILKQVQKMQPEVPKIIKNKELSTNFIKNQSKYVMKRHLEIFIPLVVNTSRFFPHSWLITGFITRLTRRVPLVEQVISGVCVTRSLVVYVFCRSLFILLYCFFWELCFLFFFDIRTDSDYPFDILKLFFQKWLKR